MNRPAHSGRGPQSAALPAATAGPPESFTEPGPHRQLPWDECVTASPVPAAGFARQAESVGLDRAAQFGLPPIRRKCQSRPRMRRLLFAAALVLVLTGSAPAEDPPPLFHGGLTIRTARGRVDDRSGRGTVAGTGVGSPPGHWLERHRAGSRAHHNSAQTGDQLVIPAGRMRASGAGTRPVRPRPRAADSILPDATASQGPRRAARYRVRFALSDIDLSNFDPVPGVRIDGDHRRRRRWLRRHPAGSATRLPPTDRAGPGPLPADWPWLSR